MLRQRGLSCVIDANDQYGRSIATCSTSSITDIGAAQVNAGMAVSHEYFGVRDYGDEEDLAYNSKRGIWAGAFIPPDEWRETHVRSSD
jgi:endonuclease YncB( thermonuclease family)